MERTEALKTLHLQPGADGKAVTDAYWSLARQAQKRAERDDEASAELERLNRAYDTLAPHGGTAAPAPRAKGAASASTVDGLGDWFAAEALRTRERWAGRNPEIALIGGSALVLVALALGAGASMLAVLIAAIVLCVALWAPWRRPST